VKPSQIVSDESQEHFWHVVRACLREFHHASPTVLGRMSKLRQKIDDAPIEEVELFFHGEPFNVACGLARQRLAIERENKGVRLTPAPRAAPRRPVNLPQEFFGLVFCCKVERPARVRGR
jgi:hypothetical protein